MIKKTIEDLEQELLDARQELEYFKSMPELYRDAIELHAACCRINHQDGCGWYYEISSKKHDWAGYTHSLWVAKASVLKQENITISTAILAYQIITK